VRLPFDSFVIASHSCVRVARPRPCRRLCAALQRSVAPVSLSGGERRIVKGRQPPKLEQGLLKGAAVHRSSFRLTFLASPSPPVPGVAMRRATLGGWPREDLTTRGQRSTGASANCDRNVACIAHAPPLDSCASGCGYRASARLRLPPYVRELGISRAGAALLPGRITGTSVAQIDATYGHLLPDPRKICAVVSTPTTTFAD
jgi:hypothetical protein